MRINGVFPSPTVGLYMGRLFLIRSLSILAGIVLILQTLDLLSTSGDILAHAGNGESEVWRYVGFRAPQIIAFALPFSVLAGTILTLSTMNQNSEITALKGLGLSAHQVLAPLLLVSLGIAVVSFVFDDRVVSRATATLSQWQKTDYGALPVDRGDRTNVWVRDGDDLIEVAQLRGRGNAARLGGITLYDRTGGNLVALIRADHGRHVEGGWLIWPASRIDVAKGSVTQVGAVTIAKDVRPDEFRLSTVDPDGLSFAALRTAISDLSGAGRPTNALEGSLWHKLSGPFSAVLMPLLGAVSAFGIARSGKLFIRAVAAMGLGFAFFVADNFALAMGNLGAYPPLLAAWAPFLLFFLVGEAVLIRSEE